jgi:hypothetical protein
MSKVRSVLALEGRGACAPRLPESFAFQRLTGRMHLRARSFGILERRGSRQVCLPRKRDRSHDTLNLAAAPTLIALIRRGKCD